MPTNAIWDNYLSYRKSLADKVLQFKTTHKANAEEELINNDLYATAMARVHYARVKEAIPDAGDIISPVQKSRWELLERIRKGNHQDTSPIFLHIDTKQYMKKAINGKYVLDYCNVFVK